MIKAVRNNIIVKREYELKSDIIILPKACDKYRKYDGEIKYTVVSVGPGYKYDLKPGDSVDVVRHEGKLIKVDGEELWVMKSRWVTGKYEK